VKEIREFNAGRRAKFHGTRNLPERVEAVLTAPLANPVGNGTLEEPVTVHSEETNGE